MDFEHEFSEFPHRSESARGTLEENARRSAKVAAWSRGIHVADPEGTMKRMFQKFIGDKLQQQLEIQSTRAAEDPATEKAPATQPAASSSSSSSSSSKKKTKKTKKVKTKKKEKKKKSTGKKKKSEMMVRLKRERQEADREVPLDPKFAKIINRAVVWFPPKCESLDPQDMTTATSSSQRCPQRRRRLLEITAGALRPLRMTGDGARHQWRWSDRLIPGAATRKVEGAGRTFLRC
ncbi:unnamed protein product [Cladocopium goreaui]|nr:unnamed protein product [Cladocopium goreaui]